MRILIADDKPTPYYDKLLKLLTCERPQDKIVFCKDALNAYEMMKSAQDQPFDLIILDEKMGGGERDGTALLKRLHSEPLNQQPNIIYITGVFNSIPANQIVHSGTQVTLFLDKETDSDKLLYRAILLVARQIEGVSQRPEVLFGKVFMDMVLSEANQILDTPQAGYLTLDQQRIIGSLIRSFFTTLKMRDEWTSEDALELSVFLAEGLCRVYDLPDDIIKLVRRFLDIEEVLYTIPRYRDHFLHQIKVFLLGFCILNRLNRLRRLDGTILGGANAMKLWFMASAFHDIGYPFEQMKKWLNTFVLGVLRSPSEEQSTQSLLPMEFNWGALFGRRYNLYHLERIADTICHYYSANNPNGLDDQKIRAELVVALAERVAKNPDHGVFSSLIIQNFLRGRLLDEEVDPVAVAVALHNRAVNRPVRKPLSGLLTFEHDPLSFLLMFCDTAQEWGRSIGHLQKPKNIGTGQILFDDLECAENGQKINVSLRFERSWSILEVNNWKDRIFENFIQSLRSVWSSKSDSSNKVSFSIQYFHGNSKEERKLIDVLHL